MNKVLGLVTKYLLPAIQAMVAKKSAASPDTTSNTVEPLSEVAPSVEPSIANPDLPTVSVPEVEEDDTAETLYFGEIVPTITKYEPVLPTEVPIEESAPPIPVPVPNKNTDSSSSKEIPVPSSGPWRFTLPKGGVSYKVVDGVICGNLRQGNPKLSPHFRANEFACACCKEYKIQIAVLEGLEEVRRKYNGPLSVAKTTLESKINPGGSGYRCPAHNAKTAGAAKNSHHLTGKAVDVHPEPFTAANLQRLWQIMQTVPPFTVGALILYHTFVHGDNGGKKKRFRSKS